MTAADGIKEMIGIYRPAHPLCAAGPWNYDMDAAPRNGTRVLLAWEYENICYVSSVDYYRWWSGGEILDGARAIAWAAINLPEVPK